MKKSNIYRLAGQDVLKGFIMTVLGMVVMLLIKTIDAGAFPMDLTSWKPILLASLGAGLTYLLKNFFTNSDDQFGKKEDDSKYNSK